MSPCTTRFVTRGRKIAIASVLVIMLCSYGVALDNPVPPSPPRPAENQLAEYNARTIKTVVELQQFRETATIPIRNSRGREGKVTLINLNPTINTWFLLRIQRDDREPAATYHLENPCPGSQQLSLDPDFPDGIVIVSETGSYRCPLWGPASDSELVRAVKSAKPYEPLGEGRLFLRNKTRGHKTVLERATDLLRLYVWKGEKVTAFVRQRFFHDAYLNASEIISSQTLFDESRSRLLNAPAEPLIGSGYENKFLLPRELGIALEGESEGKVLIGRWYRAENIPGVFVSVVEPRLVAEQVMKTSTAKNVPLDDTEAGAIVYMVAFDLGLVDMGFEIGTDHPKVNWSDRVPVQRRDPSLPGPDGIATMAPLEMTGLVNPVFRDRIMATFAGGFKRYHGAFHWSELAYVNNGSHYGFIEHGVVLSKLQPGLATILVYKDGTVDLKTWTTEDNAGLSRIRYARQTGIAIVENDGMSENQTAGSSIRHLPQGNRPGSSKRYFRSVRSALGLQEYNGRRFLIYGYFSDTRPPAMSRVFKAYHCKYALRLDMNALEHTYLALYGPGGGLQSIPQHLIKGMGALEENKAGQVSTRFVGYPDNRDFFYVLRKDKP